MPDAAAWSSDAPRPAVLMVRVEEAAEMLGLSRTAMFGLIARGEVKSVKIGSRRRVPVAALHAYVRKIAGEQHGSDAA